MLYNIESDFYLFRLVWCSQEPGSVYIVVILILQSGGKLSNLLRIKG